MRFALSVLGTEVLAVELTRSEDPPALEAGAGGQFELAAPDDYPDPGETRLGFRIT